MEFEESRPYLPGDDPRRMDWNAMARTGEPWVKRYREERGRTLMIALDASGSMAFGSGARTKAQHAAHMAALLAAAAGQAGDRVGFVIFGDTLRYTLPPARGPLHAWRIVEAAAESARGAHGGTHWPGVLDALHVVCRQRAILFLLSDFRTADGDAARALPGRLARLASRHEVVCALIDDPRERALPVAGRVRIVDPERPGPTHLLRTSSAATRRRYAAAALDQRRRVERMLRASGASLMIAPSERDPLRTLGHFFDQRAAHVRGVRA
jgi:uncharacterized protein (DUF58 family)